MEINRIAEALAAAGYTTDAVLARIGQSGQSALGRNTTLAAARALGDAQDALANLIRLFVLQQVVSEEALRESLPIEDMVAAGLVTGSEGKLRALVEVRPYELTDRDGFVVSDFIPGLDHAPVTVAADYVLGASPASRTLAQIVARDQIESALDLGTGCGVQALHLAQHAQRVVATDLNPRALSLARLSAGLNRVEADFRQGSLFEPVTGEQFDLIVSNPPYVMSPPASARLTYREGVMIGDGLVETIVRQAPAHLRDGGRLQLLTNWAIIDAQPWQDRLSAWVADTGADLWVVERERMDPYEYIEMWLADAGLVGSASWRSDYESWLAYFEQLGITEIGLGWIHLAKAGRENPDIECEQWPHSVAQPVGEVFSRRQAALDAATAETAELLASRPRLHQVNQEQLGAPGAADPTHIVLRQQTGLLRAMQVSTNEAAVLGALDGDLSVGEVMGAVAMLLAEPVDSLIEQVLPTIRLALRHQYLVP
ncbi:MAG: transferase [Arachnia propionica]|nr:MAG: transferase [Arachnia propionica]